MKQPISLLITCEHGGNRIPPHYRPWFSGATHILNSHRGWDPGALQLARQFSRHFRAPLHFSETSRLLVELNRSIGHPRLFSEFVRDKDPAEKQLLIDNFYAPYRRRVIAEIEKLLKHSRQVLHLSVHSFTPVLDGQTRNGDVGFLYDPRRTAEARFCSLWARHSHPPGSHWRFRKNYPYRGSSDGFTTYLRTCYPPNQYLGLELEVNQHFFTPPRQADWPPLRQALIFGLNQALQHATADRHPK